MAQYYTDFSEYATNANLLNEDWSLGSDGMQLTVKESATGVNGKYLDLNGTTNHRVVFWDAVPSTYNVEVLFVATNNGTSTANKGGAIIRSAPTTGWAIVHTGSNHMRLYRTLDVSVSGALSSGSGSLQAGRIRVSGTTYSVKAWSANTWEALWANEPASWAYSTSSTTFNSAGKVGLYMRWASQSIQPVWLFSVGTDGDPAPTEAPSTSEDVDIEDPTTAELNFIGEDAEVEIINITTVSPDTIQLSVDTHEAELTAITNSYIEADTADVPVATYDADIETIHVTTVSPDTAELEVATHEADVSTLGGALIIPEPAELTFETLPAVWMTNENANTEPMPQNITFVTRNPIVSTPQPMVPQVVRPTNFVSGSLTRSDTNFAMVDHVNDDSTARYLFSTTWQDGGAHDRSVTFAIPLMRPVNMNDDLTITSNSSGSEVSRQIILLDGDQVIASRFVSGTNVWSLTLAEKQSITNWNNLRVRLRLFGPSGFPTTFPPWTARFNWVRVNAGAWAQIHADVGVSNSATLGLQTHKPTIFSDKDSLINTDTASLEVETHPLSAAPGTIVRPPITLRPFQSVANNSRWNPSGSASQVANVRDRSTSTSIWHSKDTAEHAYMTARLDPSGTEVALPNLPHILRVRYFKSVWPQGDVSYFDTYVALLAGEQVLLRTRLTGGNHQEMSIPLSVDQINSIGDNWNDLRVTLETFSSIIITGSTPMLRIYWAELVIPDSSGYVSVRPEPAVLDIHTYPATLTVFSTIPEPAELKLKTFTATVTPEILNLERIGIAASSGFHVLSAIDKDFDFSWPTASASAIDVGTSDDYVVVARKDSSVITVFDTNSKQIITGFSNLPSTPYAVDVSQTAPLAAFGMRRHTDTNSNVSSPRTSFQVVNLATKQAEIGWPAMSNAVQDIKFSPDGTKLAIAQTLQPYLRVIDVATKTIETGWQQPPGQVTSIAWWGSKLVLGHRRGRGYSVYNNKQIDNSSWPSLKGAGPVDMSVSQLGQLAVVHDDELKIINLHTKTIDTGFPKIRNLKSVQWITHEIVLAGQMLLPGATEAAARYINTKTKEPSTDWPALTAEVFGLSGFGAQIVLPPPKEDVTISPSVGVLQIQARNPSIEVVQEIAPAKAVLDIQTYPAEVSAPDISITPGYAAITFTTLEPAIYPVDTRQEVGNTAKLITKTHSATVAITSTAYRLVAADTPETTARDADDLGQIDMGAVLHGSNTMTSFRIGNTHGIPQSFILSTKGNNAALRDGVEFSWDRENWAKDLELTIGANGISNVIYMRVNPSPGSPDGDCTFLLNLESVVTHDSDS